MSRVNRNRRFGLLAVIFTLALAVGSRGQVEPPNPGDRIRGTCSRPITRCGPRRSGRR